MRRRVMKLLAAFLLIVAGVGVSAAVASAVDGDDISVVSPDTNSWE